MRKVKVFSLEREEEDEEKYKSFIVVVKKQADELPSKVKYKEILTEEDDFLDEK